MPDVEIKPGRFDFGLYQGDTFSLEVQITEEIDEVVTPVDLTGHTPLAQVRLRARSPEVVATWVAVITDPAEGQVQLTLTSEESAKVHRDSVWDFQTAVSGGVGEPDIVRTWLFGDIILTNDVTREE